MRRRREEEFCSWRNSDGWGLLRKTRDDFHVALEEDKSESNGGDVVGEIQIKGWLDFVETNPKEMDGWM